MIRHLSIRNLAVIAELDLPLGDGFSVLSGETGAGKSILIDAIGLALGARADSDAVRQGAKRAEVSLEFALEATGTAQAWLAEHALDDPDAPSTCTLRRVINADGGSRAFINGSASTVANLRALGSLLLDIHGQHDNQRLLQASAARQLLDDTGRYPAELAAVREASSNWQATQQQLRELEAAATTSPQQIEFLRFQLQELERVDPKAGEMSGLAAEHKQLANAGQLLADAEASVAALSDNDDSALSLLGRVQHLLSNLVKLDGGFANAHSAIESAQISVEEAASDVQRRLDGLDLDPARLEQLDERIAELHGLARKHQVPVDELPEHLAALRAELDNAEHAGEKRATLESALRAAHEAFDAAAQKLTSARQQAGQAFSATATDILRPLGMTDAQLVVEIAPKPDAMPNPNGADHVQLLLSANPGLPPRPLAKVASGGELSRVSLALLLAAKQDNLPGCMIFDEVDAGIGGGVADIVGQRLRELARGTQVLCVTHLPQVASQANTQLHVRKHVADGQTQTQVEALSTDRRVEELARMLGGIDSGEQATAHAQSMLDAAQKRAAA